MQRLKTITEFKFRHSPAGFLPGSAGLKTLLLLLVAAGTLRLEPESSWAPAARRAGGNSDKSGRAPAPRWRTCHPWRIGGGVAGAWRWRRRSEWAWQGWLRRDRRERHRERSRAGR